MNRKKKINAILKSKMKKKNAKLQHNNKPAYVSKAEREKIAALPTINITEPDSQLK